MVSISKVKLHEVDRAQYQFLTASQKICNSAGQSAMVRLLIAGDEAKGW